MSDRWLSVEEIAQYLGISRDTVYSWVGKTNIPAHKVGKLWKFKADEIDAWVRKKGAARTRDNESGSSATGLDR